MSTYTCSKCHSELSEEDLDSQDYGAYEDYMGTKVWKSCIVYSTPCCGVEPYEKENENGED